MGWGRVEGAERDNEKEHCNCGRDEVDGKRACWKNVFFRSRGFPYDSYICCAACDWRILTCVISLQSEMRREGEGERRRQRDRDRQTDRYTDRQAGWQAGRQEGRKTGK